MSEASAPDGVPHRWNVRPVLFVEDLSRALHFYVDQLGFTKSWHSGDGTGTVCWVTQGECEIILSAGEARRDKARLFIELTAEGLRDFEARLTARSVPHSVSWWGYHSVQVHDPDSNELIFPIPG